MLFLQKEGIVIELIGQKFGHLTVKDTFMKNHKKYCLCDCDCGNKNIEREAYSLKTRATQFTSCGCARKELNVHTFGKNINGKRFGRLTVLETLWDENPIKVKCRCDCGSIKIYRKNDVQSGHTQSCGCLFKDKVPETNTKDWTGQISEYGVKAISPAYKNDKGKWLWNFECPICHNTFIMLPAKVFSGHTTSCGCKIQSSGEKMIRHFLEENNISFQPQFSFEDCKNKYVLKFDFAIFKNSKIYCLFEYNGLQHYKPIEFFGGEKGFEKTVYRDKIKVDYCNKHNIPLFIFKYNQSNDEIKEQITNIIYP